MIGVVAMAEHLAGSEEAFVEQMNNRAKELGMNDTVFKNCHGIDEDGHVTSAYDIALMSRELLINHPDITNYTTIYMDTLRDGKSQLVNTNKLIRNYKGATGLKTGSTSLALYNLSASATRDNLSLIAVVMKAPTSADRFENAKKELFELALSLDGRLSGEHGIGSEKSQFISKALDANNLKLMLQIKHLLDPKNILNPGKIFQEAK